MIATAEIAGKVRRLLNEAESDEQLSLLYLSCNFQYSTDFFDFLNFFENFHFFS